jgi:hypothetical protein
MVLLMHPPRPPGRGAADLDQASMMIACTRQFDIARRASASRSRIFISTS